MKPTMKSIASMLALATLVSGVFTTNLFAKDHLTEIKDKGTIVVGTSADYPPYESIDQDGKFVGLDMDLIREIGKRMGVKVVIKDMGFDTLIAGVQKGKLDLVIAAMQGTEERDKKVDFSTPYNYIKDVFLVTKTSGIEIHKAMDAAGKNIGVQTGTIQGKWVVENLIKKGLTKEDQLFRYERVDNAGLDLNAGRIDTLLIQQKPAQDLAKKLPNLKIALITTETVASGQCVALPDGDAALKAELDRIITDLKESGWMDKAKAQWELN